MYENPDAEMPAAAAAESPATDMKPDEAVESDGWEELARRGRRRTGGDNEVKMDVNEINVEIAEAIEIAVKKQYGSEQGNPMQDAEAMRFLEVSAVYPSQMGQKKWEDLNDENDLEEYVDQYWTEIAMDDVHGKELDLGEVRKARKEELDYMRSRGIWREVSVQEAWDKTGRAPVSVKWVDTNKGTEEEPNIRSRLVARDFKVKDSCREDLFAATPPLELLKALLSKAVTGDKDLKVLVIDVKKAHLNPMCDQDVFIELPLETGAKAGTCGKLIRWLYGFRPAAQAWENHYAGKLEEAGFMRGVASPVSFYHEELDISGVVHGDDFTFVSDDVGLDYIEGLMKEWYEVKVKARLGGGESDDKEVNILGRIIKWTEEGVEYQADPKHRQIVLEQLGLSEESKGLATNGRIEKSEEDEEDEELQGDEATSFRALAARLNYLAQDCADIQFPAKEICREMSRPTAGSFRRVKVLARFMLKRLAVVVTFRWQPEGSPIELFTDSDWAGCRRTRRSTSGGAICLGDHCLRTWSSTQTPIALSSAEAEYYSMVEGATKALGLKAMLAELGLRIEDPVRLRSDSAAATAFAARRGLGRVRHIETRLLWLQASVRKRDIILERVAGQANPADLMTKYLSEPDVQRHLHRLGMFWTKRPGS